MWLKNNTSIFNSKGLSENTQKPLLSIYVVINNIFAIDKEYPFYLRNLSQENLNRKTELFLRRKNYQLCNILV